MRQALEVLLRYEKSNAPLPEHITQIWSPAAKVWFGNDLPIEPRDIQHADYQVARLSRWSFLIDHPNCRNCFSHYMEIPKNWSLDEFDNGFSNLWY